MIYNNNKRLFYIALLLLVSAVSLKFKIEYKYKKNLYFSSIIETIPESLRSVIAGYLWTKADDYMHHGQSVRVKAKYRAGSYAGNTELIALLSLSIKFAPHYPLTYGVLAQNLSRHLNKFKEGLQVLQYGINKNRNKKWLNELYAEIAYQYMFDKKRNKQTLLAALKYITKAIKLRRKNNNYEPYDISCTIENYKMLRKKIIELLKKQLPKTQLKNILNSPLVQLNEKINLDNNFLSSKNIIINTTHTKQNLHKRLYSPHTNTKKHIHHHHHYDLKKYKYNLKQKLLASFLLFLIVAILSFFQNKRPKIICKDSPSARI